MTTDEENALNRTIREDYATVIISIEKVKNSQEYSAGTMHNRYVLLKDLEAREHNLLKYISMGLGNYTKEEAEIKLANRGSKSVIQFT